MPPISESKTTKQRKERKQQREFWIEGTSRECNKGSNEENQELKGLGAGLSNQTSGRTQCPQDKTAFT